MGCCPVQKKKFLKILTLFYLNLKAKNLPVCFGFSDLSDVQNGDIYYLRLNLLTTITFHKCKTQMKPHIATLTPILPVNTCNKTTVSLGPSVCVTMTLLTTEIPNLLPL